MSIFLVDIPTSWVGTGLAGVGRFDSFDVETSDVSMYLNAFFILGSYS